MGRNIDVRDQTCDDFGGRIILLSIFTDHRMYVKGMKNRGNQHKQRLVAEVPSGADPTSIKCIGSVESKSYYKKSTTNRRPKPNARVRGSRTSASILPFLINRSGLNLSGSG